MANIKSKVKNIARIERNTIRNKAIKSRVSLAIKNSKIAAEEKDEKLKTIVSKAHKEINTAVSKGVLHKNTGARKSSRLDAHIKKATA